MEVTTDSTAAAASRHQRFIAPDIRNPSVGFACSCMVYGSIAIHLIHGPLRVSGNVRHLFLGSRSSPWSPARPRQVAAKGRACEPPSSRWRIGRLHST